MLMNCHIGRLILSSLCVGAFVAAGIWLCSFCRLRPAKRTPYFPSEGRRAEGFFPPKNPMASAGFGPAKLGTKGQHSTPRPPKPIIT